MPLIDLANPSRFLALIGRVWPWLAAATLAVLAYGLGKAYFAPDDYQQGATAKIMFIHVPSAWLAMGCWTVMTTASLWGRPMWGTYWVWDARLTSVLVLFLMYLGVIALWRTVDDPLRAARAAAVLTLVGAVNLPIIKFSVDWWNTLHQPASVIRLGGPAIDISLLIPLLVMALGFGLLFGWLLLLRMRTALNERKARALRLYGTAAAGSAAGEHPITAGLAVRRR